ncbi:MAG: tetratricopeptide repeat protein [Chloroflexi bacterium]|nr:tetratricopeptide repeat protein [Chloroflexota bacterium]
MQAAGGNPLFVEQMLAMLIDDGLIQSVDGRWVATNEKVTVTVPPTIAALLSARLDRLEPEERDLIGRASVVGKVFYRGAVSDVGSESGTGRIDELLKALVRKDLIRPDRSTLAGEDAFRFRHILVLESAYGALPKAMRASLHERFANWLERAAGDRAEEQDEILGYHLERAYLYREELGALTDEHRAVAHRAAVRLSAAGTRAFARSDYPAAANLFSRALSLLPPDDPVRIELSLDLASVVQDEDQKDRIWAEAIEHARAVSNDRLLAHALVQRWRWKLERLTDIDQAVKDADWAMATFGRAADERGLARAWSLRGQIAWMNGQAGNEEAAIEEVLQHARQAGDLPEEYEAFLTLSRDIVRGPTPSDAGIRRCEEVIAQYANQRSVEASMFHALGHLTARRGDFERAREFAKRSRAFFFDTGQRGQFEFFAEIPYDIEMVAGEPAAAERVLREGFDALAAKGERPPFLNAFLARALCAQDRWNDAEPYAEFADAAGTSLATPVGKGSLARVRAHQGRVDEGEPLAREAVALLAGTDFLIDRADVMTDLADVLLVAGRADEAADALVQAIALYEQKGDIVTPVRIRARLDGIRHSTVEG